MYVAYKPFLICPLCAFFLPSVELVLAYLIFKNKGSPRVCITNKDVFKNSPGPSLWKLNTSWEMLDQQ